MPVRLAHPDRFVARHVGPRPEDEKAMLEVVGAPTIDALVDETIPQSIRSGFALDLPAPKTEHELLELARAYGQKNEVFRSFIGAGYHDCITPPVILRNVVSNPGWYTQYTPYQAEISQGRLEALLNFQTMIEDLTALPVANASLLDEGTAAAEAMHLAYELKADDAHQVFWVSDRCHPQTIDVIKTRAKAHGVEIVVGDHERPDFGKAPFGVLVQYPATDGALFDYRAFIDKARAAGALVVMAADPLALCVLTPPGELGADVAIGSAQRFGVPMFFGGPHAAYFACKSDFVRKLPGRIIGVSEDARGKTALRMALQTREQHIRREKATSNICTAQALLAIVASFYAAWHGPKGLRAIAERVFGMTSVLAAGLRKSSVKIGDTWFDALRVEGTKDQIRAWHEAARAQRMNLRALSETALGIALDETTSEQDLAKLFSVFGVKDTVQAVADQTTAELPRSLARTSAYLTHPTFNRYHSETEMLRYIKQLESRDLSLTSSMIPLGSCTMKLNAAAEMLPITDAQWANIHPFAPADQTKGYAEMIRELERMLSTVTGFPGVSLQPNSGAQGELAGLLVIQAHHQSKGHARRDVCLIPQSAHGTNPASAVMAGLKVVVVACDAKGNVDLADLEAKAKQHADKLSCLMITYPSTHGVFEEEIKKITSIVHEHGGQVYMDGANMNAQVGLTRPADIGADVCHINLHKTFCIPHGGGGPGMGPIACAAHLAPFLPGHPVVKVGGEKAVGAVAAAPWGSADILLISWAYIHMMGSEGLTRATKYAILNANYIARRLDAHFPVVYKGKRGRVAHECIVDVRPFKKTAHVEVDDVAKRLMDYGFHAPTMSFPIAGTLMIEPTESESKEELDRFCDAMISIREEIRAIEEGKLPADDNPLKNAPHTADAVTASEWKHPYPRELAAFPAPGLRARKFWPPVARVNAALGDRNLVCACPPIESYT